MYAMLYGGMICIHKTGHPSKLSVCLCRAGEFGMEKQEKQQRNY